MSLLIGSLVLSSLGFHLQPCHHLAGLCGNGRGAAGSGPLHKWLCWALSCRGPGSCCYTHSTQVSGGRSERGCRNPETKACRPSRRFIVPSWSHPSHCFPCSWMGQLLPCRIFSFSCLPQGALDVSFQSYFLLRLLMHNNYGGPPGAGGTTVFNAGRPDPFWILLKSFSLWCVEKCK